MQAERSNTLLRCARWVAITLFLGIGALLLYSWFFRYFTDSARFLMPTIMLLLALTSAVTRYKTRSIHRTNNVRGTLCFGAGLCVLLISWLGHWVTININTTLIRGEDGEVVNLTNYDIAFYADRYIALLALILLISALLLFLISTNRSKETPVSSLIPLSITVILLNLWLLAHIDDSTDLNNQWC